MTFFVEIHSTSTYTSFFVPSAGRSYVWEHSPWEGHRLAHLLGTWLSGSVSDRLAQFNTMVYSTVFELSILLLLPAGRRFL